MLKTHGKSHGSATDYHGYRGRAPHRGDGCQSAILFELHTCNWIKENYQTQQASLIVETTPWSSLATMRTNFRLSPYLTPTITAFHQRWVTT